MEKNKTGANRACNELFLIAECEKKEKKNTRTLGWGHPAAALPLIGQGCRHGFGNPTKNDRLLPPAGG
jgi:hypothetical protein